MPDSLLAFVLARLDRIPSPAFLHGELAGFPASDLATLVSEGLLRRAEDAEEIPRPARFPGGGLVFVRQTSRGLYGVAGEDEPYFVPIPLTQEDVRRYAVSLPKLVDRIRRENGIEGDGFADHQGLIALGQKSIDAWGVADVYLSFPNGDGATLLSACHRLKDQSQSRPIVLMMPRIVVLSPEQRRVVGSTGVILASMSDAAQNGTLALSWSLVVGSPDVGRARTYPKGMRVFQCQGSTWLVVYDGTSASVDDLIGMRYIQQLLSRPGRTFKAAELTAGVSRGRSVGIIESKDDVERLGHEDLAEYEKQIAVLDRKIAAARTRGDGDGAARLREQRALLAAEVRRAKGRPANEAPERKKPRQSVSKAIDRALQEIRRKHAGLGRHLDATVKRGATVVYQEDPNAGWTT